MNIEQKLIAAGVKNLHTYGYPDCNADNIITDPIYSAFFCEMLTDNKGRAVQAVDEAIGLIEARIKASTAP